MATDPDLKPLIEAMERGREMASYFPGWHLIGFDPGYLFGRDKGQGSIDLPNDVFEIILAALRSSRSGEAPLREMLHVGDTIGLSASESPVSGREPLPDMRCWEHTPCNHPRRCIREVGHEGEHIDLERRYWTTTALPVPAPRRDLTRWGQHDGDCPMSRPSHIYAKRGFIDGYDWHPRNDSDGPARCNCGLDDAIAAPRRDPQEQP